MTSASVFSIFPHLPPRGHVTTAELNGQLTYTIAEDVVNNDIMLSLPDVPRVSLSNENARSSVSQESAKSAFLVQEGTTWKRVLQAWYEQGISGALEELTDGSSERDVQETYTHKALSVLQWMGQIQTHLFPLSTLTHEELIAKYSPVRSWLAGCIRAFAWHPQTHKLAIAQKDDAIKVYTANSELVPLLKYKLQKHISDLRWQPFSSSILAVACHTGVLIWTIEPMSLATRPSASAVRTLQVKGHSPVTSISWNPTGSLLLSASPNDTAIIVWDVSMETYVPLRRVGAGGSTHVMWSPDGSKVYSATTSKLFRIWETQSWSCEKWSNLSSNSQAACWSPDGSILLFCTSNEPIIYSLTFAPVESSSLVGGSSSAVMCVDLSQTMLQREDGELVNVGGNVLAMVWDPTGERLAVSFTGTDGSACGIVALFRTKPKPLLEVSPCGCIVGQTHEIPEHISFKPRYEEGALLSVVWSSSRVSYIPLQFLSSQRVHNAQHLNSTHISQLVTPINIHSINAHMD